MRKDACNTDCCRQIQREVSIHAEVVSTSVFLSRWSSKDSSRSDATKVVLSRRTLKVAFKNCDLSNKNKIQYAIITTSTIILIITSAWPIRRNQFRQYKFRFLIHEFKTINKLTHEKIAYASQKKNLITVLKMLVQLSLKFIWTESLNKKCLHRVRRVCYDISGALSVGHYWVKVHVYKIRLSMLTKMFCGVIH